MIKIAALLFLTTLVSCGEDVSSNHKIGHSNNRPETTTPELGTNSSSILFSQMHREKGSAVLTYSQEISSILANDLSDTQYRVIPSLTKDDEGSVANVTTLNDLGRPNVSCGSGGDFTGINARMADCLSKNAERASWNGTRYGAAGEGNWRLVSLTDTRENWLDERTGLVWSYLLTPVNWCQAAGNTENDSPLNTVDCAEASVSLSACVGATLQDLPATQIKWRLPTRGDVLQADLNGLRFVLSQESATGLWTATIRAASQGRSEAWVYHSKDGTLSAAGLTTERQVRCVGAPVL